MTSLTSGNLYVLTENKTGVETILLVFHLIQQQTKFCILHGCQLIAFKTNGILTTLVKPAAQHRIHPRLADLRIKPKTNGFKMPVRAGIRHSVTSAIDTDMADGFWFKRPSRLHKQLVILCGYGILCPGWCGAQQKGKWQRCHQFQDYSRTCLIRQLITLC